MGFHRTVMSKLNIKSAYRSIHATALDRVEIEEQKSQYNNSLGEILLVSDVRLKCVYQRTTSFNFRKKIHD